MLGMGCKLRKAKSEAQGCNAVRRDNKSIGKVSDDLHTAFSTLPDVPSVKAAWPTIEPLRGLQISKELLARGCNQADVGDAR
jgi:hypothetical protein